MARSRRSNQSISVQTNGFASVEAAISKADLFLNLKRRVNASNKNSVPSNRYI